MRKKKLLITKEVMEHIEEFYNVKDAMEYYKKLLEQDLMGYLTLITEDVNEINQVLAAIDTYEDMTDVIKYIANGEDKNIKDIVRQAYVISNVSIPFERITPKFKPDITKEERKELDNLNIPYSINELYKAMRENEHEYLTQMTVADYLCLQKILKKNKDKKIKKLYKKFEDEFASPVPEEDVKEMHLYYPDFDEGISFMDEERLHEVVGKKARIEFLDGTKKVGYLGSDFRDEDGDECVSLFEAYNENKGFYNYNTYKIKDTLKMDVLAYPREKIDFNFRIKVRHIKKYLKGVTENKKDNTKKGE